MREEALRLALFAQIPRKLERMVNLPPDTDYAFYAGVNLVPDWASGNLFPCHPLTAILAAVKNWHDRARMRATLGRIARQPLTFHPEVDLSSFIVTGEEQAVIETIQLSSPTLSGLYDLRVAGEDAASSIVYTLAVTRSFAFTAAKGPPMVSLPLLEEIAEDIVEEVDLSDASAEPQEPASDAAWSEAVAAPSATAQPPASPAPPASAGAASPGSNPARTGAPDSRVRATSWHPAKVPASQVVDPAAVSSRPQRPVDAGAPAGGSVPSVLPFRDNQVRKAPPRVQEATDGDSERLVQAMTDFRMAEAALERGENAEAAELARKALAAEPTNLEYAAVVAWTGALATSKEAIPLAIAKLNVILKEDSQCARALLYRGRLYKRVKRSAEALRDFSAVLELNPKHSEAAMEVRLLRMKKK